jgi:hypothetical protein
MRNLEKFVKLYCPHINTFLNEILGLGLGFRISRRRLTKTILKKSGEDFFA